MARKHQQLQYAPHRRRIRPAETRFGPIVVLLLSLLLSAALLAALLIFVIPAARKAAAGAPMPEEASAVSEEATAPELDGEEPLRPDAAGTVALVDVADVRYLFDASVNGDAILFAAGPEEDALDRLVRYDTVTGEAEGVLVAFRYDTLRNPVEDDARIVYVDAKNGGGGAIRALDKATGETRLVCELAYDIPVLAYETPYLVWRERTPYGATKLFACHLGSFASVTLAVFTDGPAARSLPSLSAGEARYVEADQSGVANVIRRVRLADGEIDDYAPGTVVRDPRGMGGALVWADAQSERGSRLYVSLDGGEAKLIAENVIEHAATARAAAYCREQTVYIYAYATGETHTLSGPGENAQLAAAGENCVVWRNMADPANPVWKYMRFD